MTTLEDLAARVAALEAERADYRAVLAVVNALSVSTGERLQAVDQRLSGVERRLDGVEQRLTSVEGKLDSHTGRFNSIDEHLAEIRDLIIGRRDAE